MKAFKKMSWALYAYDAGFSFENGRKSNILTHFDHNTVVQVLAFGHNESLVYNIKRNEQFIVFTKYLSEVDIFKTGKGYDNKICNRCFVLKRSDAFEVNQTDAKGRKTTRPSCRVCRLGIDKRLLSNTEIRFFRQKNAPKKGDLWRCPICEKRAIVGVTVKIVLDHDKEEGKIRKFICDSCNTGLGRFKNGKNYLKNALEYIESFSKK